MLEYTTVYKEISGFRNSESLCTIDLGWLYVLQLFNDDRKKTK